LRLTSVKKHWGAGFEMIYFDGKQFAKLDSITYVNNQGIFDEVGDIPEVPVPGIIRHYKNYGETLIITVFRIHKGALPPELFSLLCNRERFKINNICTLTEKLNLHEAYKEPNCRLFTMIHCQFFISEIKYRQDILAFFF